MTRIIKTESQHNDRNRLSKWIVYAIRELMSQSAPDRRSTDLVAFIIISLRAISGTIEESVAAWEKRGYWVKADRFRLEWQWTSRYADDLFISLEQEDWGKIIILVVQLGQRFSKVKVPKNISEPPVITNAYERLISSKPRLIQ